MNLSIINNHNFNPNIKNSYFEPAIFCQKKEQKTFFQFFFFLPKKFIFFNPLLKLFSSKNCKPIRQKIRNFLY